MVMGKVAEVVNRTCLRVVFCLMVSSTMPGALPHMETSFCALIHLKYVPNLEWTRSRTSTVLLTSTSSFGTLSAKYPPAALM
jgi:hypothetical protein